MIKTITWPDGSTATLIYTGQGNGTIIITSDPNNNYVARSAQVTVKTTDNSKSETLTITQAAKPRTDISAATVTAANQTYNGSAKTPTPTVTLNGVTIPSSGYDVTYNNNINAGTATVTVTGKGDYTGTASGTFTIAKASRTISFTSYPSSLNIGGSGSLAASVSAGSGDGTISFSSGNTSRASVSGSTVLGLSSGTVTIYASVSAGTNYNSASTSYTLTVTNVVDLGLPSGRLWAQGNIKKSGSSYSIGSPTDYGCYFSWANTDGHMESEGYNWGTSPSDVYNNTPGHQQSGDISTSDSSHDMARACLGSPWHLPTKADVAELYDNTNMSEVTINGVKGRKFAKKTNSSIYMFIPYAGNGYGTGITDKASRFGCWTGTQYSASDAYDLFANTTKVYREDHTSKARGYTVRAVK